VAYVALAAEADLAAIRWFAVGLVLIILGCPAWVLVSPGGAANDSGPMGLAEVAKLLFGYLAALLALGPGTRHLCAFDGEPAGVVRVSAAQAMAHEI
jgi:hypothetical protein